MMSVPDRNVAPEKKNKNNYQGAVTKRRVPRVAAAVAQPEKGQAKMAKRTLTRRKQEAGLEHAVYCLWSGAELTDSASNETDDGQALGTGSRSSAFNELLQKQTPSRPPDCKTKNTAPKKQGKGST